MMAEPVDKALLGFLNGLARRQYCGELHFTDQFLREEVLGGMAEEGESSTFQLPPSPGLLSPSEYDTLLRRYQALLSSIVSGDMDHAQLDAFLTSQTKKRQVCTGGEGY